MEDNFNKELQGLLAEVNSKTEQIYYSDKKTVEEKIRLLRNINDLLTFYATYHDHI